VVAIVELATSGSREVEVEEEEREREGRGRRRCRRDLQCLLTSKVFDAGGEDVGWVSGWKKDSWRRQVLLQASGSKQEQDQVLKWVLGSFWGSIEPAPV
jgi:hypothetical protein